MNNDTLNQITQFSELAFTIDEICVVLNLDPRAITVDMDEQGPFYKAFQKGRLLAKAKIRKNELELASRGHVDAQKRFEELLNAQEV